MRQKNLVHTDVAKMNWPWPHSRTKWLKTCETLAPPTTISMENRHQKIANIACCVPKPSFSCNKHMDRCSTARHCRFPFRDNRHGTARGQFPSRAARALIAAKQHRHGAFFTTQLTLRCSVSALKAFSVAAKSQSPSLHSIS